jgi:hypothetical protein
MLAASTPLLPLSDRPSSIARPEPESRKWKSATSAAARAQRRPDDLQYLRGRCPQPMHTDPSTIWVIDIREQRKNGAANAYIRDFGLRANFRAALHW